MIRERSTVDREAKASRQQVRLLTTALLEEVRASSSVGGGGRKKAEPDVKPVSESPPAERKERDGGTRK
jgi:hypothetical protein